MAVKYQVNSKRNGLGINSNKFYALPIQTGTVSSRQLAKDLSARCSLTESDVIATLIGLSDLMQKYLSDGYSVKLDDIGRFYLSVSSDGFDTAEECSPKKVKFKKLCFRADKELRTKLMQTSFKKI